MHVRSPRVIALLMALGLSAVAPISAQQPGFGPRPDYDIVVPRFADAEVTRLLGTLDTMLAVKKEPTVWATDAAYTLWDFARHLQTARLTATQEARVLSHLDQVAAVHPESPALVDKTRRMLTQLTIGKTAPDIVGSDLDGVPFKLSDYRGKVVLLVFSGEWCGICRTQYPYERFLQELYKDWPFAILGVESGDDPALAKKTNGAQGSAVPTVVERRRSRGWHDRVRLECRRLAGGLPHRRGRRHSLRRSPRRESIEGRAPVAARTAADRRDAQDFPLNRVPTGSRACTYRQPA